MGFWWRMDCQAARQRVGQPAGQAGRAKRGRAVNRALRARIKRKQGAIKQEATQLPRLNCLGSAGMGEAHTGLIHVDVADSVDFYVIT